MSKTLRMTLIALAVGAAGAASGCGGGEYTATVTATTATPTLVSLYPGVWVVAYHDYPVFYSDGYYWRWDRGRWYRSPSVYATSWVRVRPTAVPVRVRNIDRPRRYVRYRPSQRDAVRRGPPPARVRDYREPERPPQRDRRYRDGRDRVPADPGSQRRDDDRERRRPTGG